MVMAFLVPWHRQRNIAEKNAVHLEWQGPFRNARFGKLPPPQQGCSRTMMLWSLLDSRAPGSDFCICIIKNCICPTERRARH